MEQPARSRRHRACDLLNCRAIKSIGSRQAGRAGKDGVMRRRVQLLAATLLALSSSAAAQQSDLQTAVLAGNAEAVRTLIAAGADVNEQGDLGTPLHAAVLKDDATISSILLDHGARIEATSEPYEMRPLHVAASYGSPAVAALLLERGAEVDPKELSRRTPLMLAATFGHLDIAEALLAH